METNLPPVWERLPQLQIPIYGIGQFINDMRTANHLTINALSKKSKVCYRTIKKLEQDKDYDVNLSTIKRLIETMTGPEEIILDPIVGQTPSK